MAFRVLAVAGLYAAIVAAAPAPEPTAAPAPNPVARAAPAVSNEAQLSSSLKALSSGPQSEFAAGYTALLSAIVPAASPTDAKAAATRLSAAYSAYPSDYYGLGAEMILTGMTGGTSFADFASDLEDFGPVCNGYANNNPPPPQTIYPKKQQNDAPYDVSEQSLRSAIYIPPGFSYGKVKPAIFIPGTGVEACENFAPNLGKLFTGSNYADPVYVNVPMNMLGDIQTNAEYVAYAVNYISSISHSNVSVLSWSQGGPAAQWAYKYWPSTRNVTSDHISISADYDGTVLAPLICPPGTPCPPCIYQQYYNSNFMRTLNNNGGSSAYVPTTEVHSIFDEIVEPQQDPPYGPASPGASAHMDDARGVGESNVQIQNICTPGTPAGGPNFGHESSLYSAVTYVVAMDAIKNSGSANIQRSGASGQCQNYEAMGLTLADAFATEANVPLAGFNILTYPPQNRVVAEPPIKSYAAADQP